MIGPPPQNKLNMTKKIKTSTGSTFNSTSLTKMASQIA